MVDSPNYANSPLANPDFLNRVAPAPTVDPGFAPMAPGILDRAIAQEPVFQAKTLEERKRELEIEQASLKNRSAGEIIQDTLLTGANAYASNAISVAGLGLKGIGAAIEYMAPDGSITKDVGGLINDRAVIQASKMTNGTSDLISLGKSEVALRNAQIDGQISKINDKINLNQYEEDLAGGDNEFIASLSLYGRQALDFTDRMSDPVAGLDLVSNALGSIASGSILSKIGSRIATGVAERFGMEGVKKLGLEFGGSALGMGVTEASSTYVSTVDEVMGRTPEQMAESELYRELTGLGMAHEEAQAKVADSAGLDAFVNQLPAAMAAGLLSARFNANPLSVMRGENPLGVFITAGKEALEETAQGATGQYNQNKAIRDFVDPNQALDEGVVDQAVGGLLGGFGASGIIGAPSGVVNSLQEQADQIKEKVAYERSMAEKPFKDAFNADVISKAQRRLSVLESIGVGSPDQTINMGGVDVTIPGKEANYLTQGEKDERNFLRENIDNPETIAKAYGLSFSLPKKSSPAEDLFNSVVNKGAQVVDVVKNVASAVTDSEVLAGAVESVKAGVQTVKEAAVPVVNKVIKAAQDYNEQGNPVIQNETVAAAESVVADALDPAVETGNLGTPDTTVTKESLPEIFRDNVPESASLAETMTNIVKTIAEKKVPISSMTDDAILFVTQKFNDMQNAASTLAPEVQDKIKKVLASPDLERIRKRAARLDLNTAISSTIEKVSPTVKAMTVAMSKINPTNVNPDVVDKILKQEDRGDLTPEDIQDMEIGASVSRPMNQLINNIVKIEDDRNAFLVSTGQKPNIEENSFEKVSRRLIEGDPTNQEKLPSVKKSVNQIILGMRSPNKTVEVDGVQVPVKNVIEHFKNLTRHMLNKVDALNKSFDQNDEEGVGPRINYSSLSSKTGKFIPVGQVGSGNANYNKGSNRSVTFAKTVGADATMMVEVHNALAKAYPDQFPDGPIALPVLKTQESENTVENTTAVESVPTPVGTDENAKTEERILNNTGTIGKDENTKVEYSYKKSDGTLRRKITYADGTVSESLLQEYNGNEDWYETNTPIRTKAQRDSVPVQMSKSEADVYAKNDQDGLFNKADENAQTTQDVTPDQTPETQAVEDATPVASETDAVDDKIIAYLNERKVMGNGTVRKLKTRKPTKTELTKVQRKLEAMSSFVRMDVSTLLSRIYVYDIEEGYEFGGFAFESDEGRFGIEGAVIAFNSKTFTGDPTWFDHVVAHEMGHVIDYTYAASLGFSGETASFIPEFWAKGTNNYPNDGISREDPVEVKEDGSIFAEVKASIKRADWFKNYFSYALGYDESIDVSTELFAELVAMHTVYGDRMAKDFPKFLAHYNKVLTTIGGKIEINEEATSTEGGSNTETPEGSVSEVENKVSDRFVSVFRPKKNNKRLTAKEILDRIAEKDGTETYLKFATILMGRISAAMNNRLQTVLLSKDDGRSVAQALKEDQATILEYMKIKPMTLVDPETGRYNQELLDLASMAVIDWMTTARSYGADRLDDMLKELGLTYNDVPKHQIRDLLNSVPPRTTSEGLAKKVIKLWGVQVNRESEMGDIRGITEGLVKEIFTVISQMKDPLVRIIELKTGEGRTASFEISNLKGEQEAIGLNAAGSLDKVLFPEDQIQASFGEKITYVPKTQNNKADVPLSVLEQKAIKKMQDTAHTEALPVVNFFAALGLDAWAMMAGKKDSSALGERHPLRLTIEGKNASIERDFETAFQMVTAAAGRPVFYPVGVTNVGRHQMKGINPQNNKLLRAMITPTHSKLNMASNQKHKNAFWLTVAQSSGLAKVEKKMHTKILSTIQEDFAAKFGEATGIALTFLETGTLDTQSFAAAMLKANKGEDVGVAQVNAVLAVARLQQAQKAGTLDSFETSLSFELDGKTDGPANMMVAFGQGIMTRMEYQNFKRVGLFLGSKGETLNSLFSGGEVDLYEVNSTFADIRMTEMINSSTGMDKKRLMALQRFAARFGDFVINPDGTIQMSRATSKNPMTKKVYGSGENGIAEGIAQDMLVGFYTKLIALGDGQSVEDHLNYQEINQDLDLLFGVKLPDVLDVNNFILPDDKIKPFEEFVKETIGKILSESINEVMSEKTTGVNDLLVFSTGVQGQFMKLFFEQRLAEAMSELNEEYEDSDNQKKGKPALRKMPQSTYDAIVKETLAFAPYFADGLQNLRIGDFTGQVDKTEMSSNLSGNIRAKSTMARPDDMGVKAIPYVIQGRGDAMMMNRIFGADNAPERAIPIFDGIDMAITDFTDLADQINEAVLSNWDQDVLGPIVSNFDAFLARVEEQGLGDKLQAAFSIVKKDSENKTSVTALDPSQVAAALAEVRRLNQARKAVFKRITLAVDHMGGSGQAYIRNYDGKELIFEEINDMIQDELDGIEPAQDPALPAPVVDRFAGVEDAEIVEDEEPVVVTDVATVVDALIRETKPHLRDVIRAIRRMLPDDARIVMGTEEQITQWRKENLGQNQSKKLDQKTKGFYDVDNNIIFILSDNHETTVHEMIHMATFQAVLDHYQGTKKSTAVKNLEVLMEEFLALDTTTMSKEAQEAYFDAKRAVVKAQAEASPMGDAMALNEFMAWTLANDGLMRELKQTPTGLVARLTKVAKAWIQRILGVVPLDMYSHILFNTEMIRNDESDWDGTPPPPATPTVGVTPPADAFTNFWIDRLRDALEASKTPDGKNTQDKLIRYITTADDALVKLDFGGFSLSEYQKKTFVAIHAVIAAELRLDPNALIALGKVYEHITNNLTPQMFGTGQAAQDRYSAVMELMGATKNDEGISDAIAVMLALSQTSNGFRTAMEQIPQPAAQPGIDTASLNDLLTSTTGFLMQKLIATTDTEGKGVKEILDALSDQILRQDNQNEFRALKGLMGTFDKADAFVGGALSLLAQKTRDLNRGVQASQTNGILKVVSGSVALATAFMDKNTSAQAGKGAKAATHMDGMLDGAIFIRELVAEIVGADAVNSDTIQMLDKVTYVVQSTRQAYREELPVVLQNEFTTHPDAKQWKALHWVLGKTDFASLFDLTNPDDSFDMLNDQTLLDRRIKTRETKIMKAFPGQDGKNILEKAQQLADFMNGKGAGFQLMKNAYAIHKLAVGQNNKPNMVAEIDKLVSLYALNGTDIAQREAVAAMQASDPNGVHNLLVYVQALNKEEDQKTITEAARTNGYKGYIPDHGQGEVSLIIARDTEREDLEKRGYVRVADDTTDSASLVSRGYYMTTVKQSGNYSQGVLQQVQDTYRGVNAVTGLTVNGTTSGVIAGVAVSTITDALNQSMRVADPKNVLLPVYDEDGAVLYYERGINPDLREKYLQPESNMALMTGVWAGRQVEEKFSHEYNKALVQRQKEIWDNRESGTDGLFIRMDQAKDKIYAESWDVIPPQLKEHILETFGEADGFMVRKDMINLALGYRDPSIVDVWTGNHRLPESVELAIKTVGKFTMGDKAYKWLANSESLTMNTISTAKDMIVVRSLVVPYMNTQSNVFQLVNRGVGTKQIMRGYKEKFVEIEKLNQNLKKIMRLQAQARLAATNKNKVAILEQQIQVLEDENERFSVSPLVKEGAYKSISEGMTELDVSITDGKFGDWVENQLDRLPTGVKTVAKYGLLSKDTALYKGANKAVQYGDFVAKSIYYDDLRAKGLSHDAAMVKVNEEFINFSLLPGRTRTYLESMGATWFLTFKIRSMQVALQMMRENPVRSLAAVGVFGLDSGPVTDNLATKALEGTLPYSLGLDMLWDAPSINPWWTAING